ncbi:MAG: SDR family oxidoreductase [Pseudomonadota bacterium]
MTDTDTPLALITGASRGLGAALAEALAPTHDILAVARTTGALEELDDRIQAAGGKATLAPLDITKADAMQHLCRSIYDRWGGLAMWVHTAIHAAPLAPTPQINDKDWAKSHDINVEATRRLIAYVAPLLGTDSRAVFFDDTTMGAQFHGAYGATKAAQIALARNWQAETRRIGPKVVIAEPAAMPTALRARFHPGEDRDALTQPVDEAARLLPQIIG